MKYIIGHIKPDLDSTVAPIALKYLYSQAKCYKSADAKPVLAEEPNNETKTVFKKFDAEIPEILKNSNDKDQFILVDHNETSQRHTDIKDDQVVEIVDHHKVAVNFSTPIFFTVKPWGSSSTIIYFMMQQNNVKPGKKLASLMISAILSDTVGLKSPTTTEKDKEVIEELNKIAQIKNLDELTLEIFKAKSDISKLTPAQIVTNDYKIFDFSDNKVLINQIETVEQDKVLEQKENLIKAMQVIKVKEELDYIFCAITDILKINTKMLYLSDDDQEILEFAFDSKGNKNIIDIGPKMSRKKEFAPAIGEALKSCCNGGSCCGGSCECK